MRTRLLALTLVLSACADPTAVETGPDAPLLFLVQRSAPASSLEALYQGPIHVDQQGCFRLALQVEQHTVIWPFGFRLARDQASLILLEESGDEVGRIGENLRLGGGVVAAVPGEAVLAPAMGAAAATRCPGPFWIAGDVLPAQPR